MQIWHKMQRFAVSKFCCFGRQWRKVQLPVPKIHRWPGFYLIRILPFTDRIQSYRASFSVFLHLVHMRCIAQKWSFPLRISSVNWTKSLVFCTVVMRKADKTQGNCILYLGKFSLYTCFMVWDLTIITS